MTWPFLFVAALYALHPVTLSIYPQFAQSPATLRLTVLVPRHAQNRNLCYSIDGPEYKQSCFTLNGAEDRRTWTVYWDLRTAGEYDASADLTRIEDGRQKVYRDTTPFRVIGFEAEP